METDRFQEFVEQWPDRRLGREVDLTKATKIPISMFVNHFDEVCLPSESVITSETLEGNIDLKYEVYIDEAKAGHAFFANSNE